MRKSHFKQLYAPGNGRVDRTRPFSFVLEGIDMTLDEFVQEETKRLALFAAYWHLNADRNERSPEGEVIWPMDMNPGEWDMQYMGFDVLDAASEGLETVDTPQGFVVRNTPSDATDG